MSRSRETVGELNSAHDGGYGGRQTALRRARVEAGLGVDRLAALAGVSRQTIWRAERGLSTPLPVVRDSLAAVLGVDPAAIWPEAE